MPRARYLIMLLVATSVVAALLFAAFTRNTVLAEKRAEIDAALLAGADEQDPSGKTSAQMRGVLKNRREFHVSPTGNAFGDGSIDKPWSLEFVLGQPPSVRPGDIIWLRHGAYQGHFISQLQGQKTAPVVVRQYPGERANLKGCGSQSNAAVLTILGGYSWFWGFEVSSCIERNSSDSGSFPEDVAHGAGIDVRGSDTKVIRLVIHDSPQGIFSADSAVRSEISENVIFHNGWDGSDRAHGHGIYIQNERGTKPVTGNIVFSQFRNGIQAYTQKGHIDAIFLRNNIVFMNGSVSKRSGLARNILYGGDQVASKPLLVGNATYYPVDGMGGNNLGYQAGCSGARVLENYFVGPGALAVVKCEEVEIKGNVFFGKTEGLDRSRHPDNSFLNEKPNGSAILVHPSKWELGRATITVYNWAGQDSVSADISRVGLQEGDRFILRNVQDYFQDITYGVYGGEAVPIRMVHRTIATPLGGNAPASTFPEFGVFVLEKTEQEEAPAEQLSN